jgi:uncharacterized protein (TIGR02996 family)
VKENGVVVDDEVAFLLTLAATPDDYTAHLVYADWLQEQDDPGAECLRAWVELVQHTYDDSTWRQLSVLFDRYRAALHAAEPEWVTLVGEARPWVPKKLAVTAARLYLRARHGRKADRQWINSPFLLARCGVWWVYYWQNNPDQPRRSGRRQQRRVNVDLLTAQAEAEDDVRVERAPETAT